MKHILRHKWIIFTLCIWAFIFCVPALRYHLHVATKGSPWIPFAVLPNSWDARFGADAPELAIQVSAIKDRDAVYFWPKEIVKLNQLDSLIQQHPDNPWLIALRLQVTTVIFKKDRVGGELSDTEIYENLQSGIPSPETTGEEVNFSPAQIQRTLELCRRGEKLEPQNAFFTWMRARFLLIDWQDHKAWQALDAAAQKTYWNSHYYDYVESYLDASAIALNRPLLPIEKLDDSFTDPNFPIHAQTREICRIINWEGIKHKRAGQHTQALQIWSNLHHVMFLAAQGDSDMISFYTDHSMMAIAQSGATYPSREILKNGNDDDILPLAPDEDFEEKVWSKRVQGFVNYAQKYYNAQIAQQIEYEARQIHQLLENTNDYSAQHIYMSSPIVETQFRQLRQSGELFAMGVILILLLSGCVLLWLLSLCISYVGINKSTFPETNSLSSSASVKRIRICKFIIFILGIALIFYLLGSVSAITTDSPANIRNFWQMLPVTFHFSFTNFTDKLLSFTGQRGTDRIPTQLWRIAFLLVPFIASGFYLLQKRFCRQTHHRGRNILEGWICILSVLILTSLIPQIYLNHRLETLAKEYTKGEMTFIHQLKNIPPER